MKIRGCLLPLIGALAGLAASPSQPGRHLLLAERDDAPGRVRFLSLPVELAEGAKSSWVTLTRTGRFTDPRYGEFEITPVMLAQMVSNFEARVLGQDVFIDVAHAPSNGAAARVLRLAVEGNRLRALVEWTDYGIEAVRKRGFAYLSAEYHEAWRDNEKGEAHGCVLLAAGLTTRPVIKHLDRVTLSEGDDPDDTAKLAIHPHLLKTLESAMNKHLQALRTKLLSLGLTEAQIAPIIAAATKQLDAAADDDAKCLALVDTFAAAGDALATQLKQLGTAAPGPITLQVGQVDDSAIATAVTKALAARDTAAAADATTLAAKVKLLTDTVGESKTLSDDVKTAIVGELRPLVTKELSDDQVKALATYALGQAGKVTAATQLATLGYRPASGSVHITVESGNQIKALQVEIDKRLGFAGMPDADRYERTGGKLLDKNKAFAEKALAQYDDLHGHRLAAEHKLLAAGVGQIGDFAVPAVFERTVLREALYQLTGLSFVDVGTAPMAAVLQIPYSYRDSTAAGINKLRVYELQAIQNAGVIQTYEEARPIPQKLGFKISNEMRYLLNAAPIDFDPLAENVRNVIRIVGEDTDKLIQNEVLNSADEFSVAAGNDTITAQVNGTNKIFVLTQFPVVRPRRIFDLKGVQQGATVNPIVVTLNSVARTEYVTGVTLSAGLYWVMDYNLGEIRFVNENGVLQTPTNAWPLVVTYSYTTNVAKHDLDVAGYNPATVAGCYDALLTKIGARKVVIENDRYYTANMLLMSGAVDNAMGQATTFMANSSRPGYGLNGDGSVGIVKGISAFNTRAPGLATADQRIVIGQRGNTRLRMMRPFQMAEMEQARDSSGFFVGAQDGYGEQFLACHTPTQLKNANTSIVLFSTTGRVARAS